MFVEKIKQLTGLVALLGLFVGLVSSTTHAAYIDFDDITARPSEPFHGCLCGHDLGNQYASQGVIFPADLIWLVGYKSPDGENHNEVFGFNSIAMDFIGTLPNFVSFNIYPPAGIEAFFIDVFGANGYLFTHVTSGWTGFEETNTPLIPGELVSINSSEEITRLDIRSLFGLRTGPISIT